MFSENNGVNLVINDIKTAGKSLNTWKLYSVFLYKPWVREEALKEKIFNLHRIE